MLGGLLPAENVGTSEKVNKSSTEIIVAARTIRRGFWSG
jgi:hypothetical protein